MDKNLTLEDFNYEVSAELIAQVPLKERTSSKLLIYNSLSRQISHSQFSNIAEQFSENDLLIFNNSKVFNSRFFIKLPNKEKKVEIFLLEPLENERWKILAKPLASLKSKTDIALSKELTLTIHEFSSHGFAVISFNQSFSFVNAWLDENGEVPLPPYIKRIKTTPEDKERYQTVYAEPLGSVAAPTAGLHFDRGVLEQLRRKNISTTEITLHVGGGTFLPVKNDNLDLHYMHEEKYCIAPRTIENIKNAYEQKGRIICVGTTTFRSLEAFFTEEVALKEINEKFWEKSLEKAGRFYSTKIFIRPTDKKDAYKPLFTTGLITNFHQPKSTLFMLICALVGLENAKNLYDQAQKNHYRFFSYGDSSLLWL